MKAFRLSNFEVGHFKASFFVKIDKKFTVITTETIRLTYYTKEIFPERCYQLILDEGIYVTLSAWEQIIKSDAGQWAIEYKHHTISAVVSASGKHIQFDFTEKADYPITTHRKWNRPEKLNKTSQYKGVNRNGRYWVARISVNGIIMNLGYFKTEDEAHDARIEAVKLYRNGEGI